MAFPTLIALDAAEAALKSIFARLIALWERRKLFLTKYNFSHILLGKELGYDPEIEDDSYSEDNDTDSDDCVIL